MRWMPWELLVSDWRAVTTRVLSAARPGSGIRPPSMVARSRSVPLRTALLTSAVQSTKVAAPGSAQVKVMVLVDSMTSPSSNPRMSTAMSYRCTSISAARAAASAWVRLATSDTGRFPP